MNAKSARSGTTKILIVASFNLLALFASGFTQAIPAGSEYPATWTITNPGTSTAVATGTTPSGIVVTVTVTAPATIDGNGSLIFNGSNPSYFPTTTNEALWIGDAGVCSASFTGCGTVKYSFSKPVKTPILYLGDEGALAVSTTNGVTTVTGASDHFWTLPAGNTFSLDSTGSQSPGPAAMSIQNASKSVGLNSPANIPTSGVTSCSGFGCGAYDINGAGTINSLTFSLGFASSVGNPYDSMTAILGITPAPPTVTLAKKSINGVGTFGFTLTNLSAGSDSITTVTSGNTVMSANTETGTVGRAASISETSGNTGYITGISCADANAATDGVGSASPITVASGTLVTIPTTGMVIGAAWTCTYTNTATANVSITKTDNLGGIYSPGGKGTYTIAVTNAATAAATVNGATVSDLLPAGLTVASPGIVCTPSGAGTSCSGSGSAIGTAGTGSLNVLAGLSLTLPPSGTVTITIPVTYSGTPASY